MPTITIKLLHDLPTQNIMLNYVIGIVITKYHVDPSIFLFLLKYLLTYQLLDIGVMVILQPFDNHWYFTFCRNRL